MANQDIGFIVCPISGEREPVRRCATGKRLFYWNGAAGKITPNMAMGQRYIYDNATFTDPEDKRQLAKKLGLDVPEPVAEPVRIREPGHIREKVTRVGGAIVPPAPEPVPDPVAEITPEPVAAVDKNEGFEGLEL